MADVLTLAIRNVRGFVYKVIKLCKRLKEKKINIGVIIQINRLKDTVYIEDYMLVYSGVTQNTKACFGVGIMVDQKWKNHTKL